MNSHVLNLLKEMHQTLLWPSHSFSDSLELLDATIKTEIKTLSEISKDLKMECIELIPSEQGLSQWKLNNNQKFLTGLYCLRKYIAGQPFNQLTETEFFNWCKNVKGWYWKSHFSSVTAKEKENIVIEYREKYRSPDDDNLCFNATVSEIRKQMKDLEQLLKRARKFRL